MQLRSVPRLNPGLNNLESFAVEKDCPPSHDRNKSKTEPKLELHF